MQVVNWDRAFLDKTIAFYNKVAPDRAYNRMNGVCFKQRGYIDRHTNVFLGASQAYTSNLLKIDDLNKWSAAAQHIDCGLTFKDEVHHPEWIKQNYIKCGGSLGKTNYPEDLAREKRKQEQQNWAPNEIFKRVGLENGEFF